VTDNVKRSIASGYNAHSLSASESLPVFRWKAGNGNIVLFL